MAELDPRAPLDEGYWESLGVENGASTDPFAGPPPGHDADPFAYQDDAPTGRSRYVPIWMRSYKGVDFIDVFVGDSPDSDDSHELVFLFEVPGVEGDERWNVGCCPSKTTEGGDWLHEGVTYDQGKKLAERYAMNHSVDAGGNADWRLGPPSPGQIRLIQRIGLEWDLSTATKGQASDLLNRHFDSRVLDPDFAS